MLAQSSFSETRVKNLTIKNWDESERPRERLLNNGSGSLSDAELLAILFRSGYKNINAIELAKTILSQCNYNLENVLQLSYEELLKFRGIGKAKAANIACIFEIFRRIKVPKNIKNIQINSTKQAFDLVESFLFGKLIEEFWVIFLTSSNKFIGRSIISCGGINETVVDERVLFKKALNFNAVKLILAHNHPSGNLEPSQSDILLTQKLFEAGKLLNINIIDHIIYSQGTFFSFVENGILSK